MGVAALLVIGLVPGLLVTLLVFPSPDRLSSASRLVLAAVYSLVASTALGLLLVNGPSLGEASGAFTRTGLAGALVLLAAALAAAVWRRPPPWRAHARQWLAALRSPASWCVLALALAYALFLDSLYAEPPRRTTPVSWYYLRDVLALVESGAIPSGSTEYGVSMPFEVNKIAWYLFVASWALLSGTLDAFALERAQVGMLAFALPFATWVFFRGVCQTRWAALLGTLLIASIPWALKKMIAFRGENFGIVLLLPVMWLAIEALRRRELRWGASAGLALGLLVTSHLVPGTVALAFVAAYTLASLLLEPRAWAAQLRVAGALALCAALFAGSVALGTGRSVGENQSGLGAPEHFRDYEGYDPAKAFECVAYGRPLHDRVLRYRPDAEAGGFYLSPGEIYQSLLSEVEVPTSFTLYISNTTTLLSALFLAVVTLAFQRRSRALGLAIPLTVLLLYGFALALSYRFHTYLPAAQALRREFPYLPYLAVVWLCVAADVLFVQLRARLPAWAAHATIAAIAAVFAAGPALDAHGVLRRQWDKKRAVTPAGHAALRWLARHTAPDDLILPDGASDGLVSVLTGRASLSEGRAPYFQPESLRRATDALQHSILFFRAPDPAWLEENGVDWVVTGSSELALRTFARDGLVFDLRGQPFLRERVRYGPVAIYQVTSGDGAAH